MTLKEFEALPAVLAKRDSGGRCMLCGEPIRRGEMIKDAAVYEKIHTACERFAASRLAPDRHVTLALRKNFLAAREEEEQKRAGAAG